MLFLLRMNFFRFKFHCSWFDNLGQAGRTYDYVSPIGIAYVPAIGSKVTWASHGSHPYTQVVTGISMINEPGGDSRLEVLLSDIVEVRETEDVAHEYREWAEEAHGWRKA